MRFVQFEDEGIIRLGALVDGQIVDLSGSGLPASIREVILQGESALHDARQAIDSAERIFPMEGAVLRNPLPSPSKIVAVGLNYLDHCREQGVEPPSSPLIFSKFPSSLIGPNEPIRWDPFLTSEVDPEIELGVIIGARVRNVSVDEALGSVFGYTIANDVSARDLQTRDGQWTRAKSLDTFCPIGPAIVTRDEISDPQQMAMKLLVDERVQQESSTAEMVFTVAQIISHISQFATLEPGDLILTGTPWGVGCFRKPPVFLQGGEIVTCMIKGLGTLRNPTLAQT